ncbi:MAG TPA: TetR/AcrR family transcriptional regulator [Geobacteraceae bacterium]
MNKRSGDETKQNILAATRQVFSEHGYDVANMRTIAQTAGVSVGGLYLYFRSKEELYLTLMAEWMEELDSVTNEALLSLHDPREEIAAFIRINLEFALSRKEMILIRGRELGHASGNDLKRRFFRHRRAIIEAIIARGIEAGVFRVCDVEGVSKVIFNIIRGFITSMIIDEEALFAPQACTELVLNGLMGREDR